MNQKCPECGTWCFAKERSFIEKADDAGNKVFDKAANIGSKIGGIFGKNGENLGRKIGILSAGSAAGLGGLLGGVAQSDCHFVCPNCGNEWDANEDEDQADELQSEEEGLITKIAHIINIDVKSEEEYYNHDVEGLCRELASHDYCASLFWLSKAQMNVAISKHQRYCDILKKGEDEENDSYLEESNEWLTLAYKSINQSLKFYVDEVDFYEEKDGLHAFSWALNQKAWIEYYKAENIEEQTIARNSFISAMDTDYDDVRSDALSGYQICTDRLLDTFNSWTQGRNEFLNDEDEDRRKLDKDEIAAAGNNKFSNLPLLDRQFVFITKEGADSIAGCVDEEENIKYVFTLDALPKGLTFPIGHPQQNTLYVANPVKKGYYLPYEGSEELLFHDKVEDFCRLAQCLGAVEITFNSVQGKTISESSASSFAVNAEAGRKMVKGSVSNEMSGTSSSDRSSSKEVGLSFTFKPTRKPFYPDDIEWLDVDPSWKTFVTQRLEGNILSYTKRISSSETTNISSSKKRGVKASFETLISKVDISFDSTTDTTFNSSENTVWEISVKFKSLDEFDSTEETKHSADKSDLILSEAEEKYKDEVLFVLEDGAIGESERRLLERKRQKFGVSEERAKLIEESCAPSLSEEEQEYLATYKDMLSDGEISEKRRKILNREAESLGISLSRASELEAM